MGQEPAHSKCVLFSTSRVVRKDWVLSCEGDQWSVRFDVRDLGGHLDTTFRGWSSTLSSRARLVISRLVLIFVLPLDFHGRVRVVRSMYLPAAVHGIEASFLASESLRKLRLVVILLFVLFGLGFVYFVDIWLFGLLKLGGFIVFWRWLVRVVLGMVLFIFFLQALLEIGFQWDPRALA